MKSEDAECHRDDNASMRGGASPDVVERGPWLAVESLPPLDRIVDLHVTYVRGVVGRFSVTPPDAREDLVQEVLLEAYRSRGSRLDVRALLFGITRHLVFHWMARHKAERNGMAQLPAPETITERTAEDDWQERERREAVRLAIADLPDFLREVFVRCELQEMTMPEVASDLAIPVNTGYTRLHLARPRFRASLRRRLASCDGKGRRGAARTAMDPRIGRRKGERRRR